METITTTPQNHYINKYGKTLHQLTWFSLPPAEETNKLSVRTSDPLNIMENKPIIKEKPKVKPPTFIPNEIMRNILSYLPPPVVKAEEYGIMNNKKNDGCFMIIKKITPKFVVYDRCKWYKNGNTFPLERNKRSKLRKDQERRCYYIVYQNEEFIVDNKLPVLKHHITTEQYENCCMNIQQYKKLLREFYYYFEEYSYAPVNYYWFNRK